MSVQLPQLATKQQPESISTTNNEVIKSEGGYQEFYAKVDTFLAQKPPSFKNISKSKKTTKTLPELKQEKKNLMYGAPKQKPTLSQIQSRIRSKTKTIEIDPQKLQEAFDYANKFQLETQMESLTLAEEGHNNNNNNNNNNHVVNPAHTKSSKTVSQPKKTKKKALISKANPYRSTRDNGKEKGNQNNHDTDWDSADPYQYGSGGKGMDPQLKQQLLNNLESGAALKILRKQLEESKNSFNTSNNFLQNATREFLHSKSR